MFRYKAVHLQCFYDLYVQLKTVETMAIPSWITPEFISGAGGKEVKITATANNGAARSGTLTVRTASGLTKTVSLKQDAPVVFFAGRSGYIGNKTLA